MKPGIRRLLVFGCALLISLAILLTVQSNRAKCQAHDFTPPTRVSAVPPQSKSVAEGIPAMPGSARVSDAKALKRVPEWRNLGNANPRTAFETLFWAKESVNLIELPAMMTLTPEARLKAQEAFEKQATSVRDKLGVHTAEQFIALVWASGRIVTGFEIKGDEVIDSQNATLTFVLEMERADWERRGTGKNVFQMPGEFKFQREATGWRMVVDERGVESILRYWDRAIERSQPTSPP